MRIKREGSSAGTGAVAELFGLRRAGGRRSRQNWFDAVAEGKLDDVVADIAGPASNETDKSPPIVREQGPRSFLEARQIAGHRRHEMIGRLSCGAPAIAITARPTRLLNQPAQCHRGPAGLWPEPFPVPWQRRDFAGDDAKFGPPATTRLRHRKVVGGGFQLRRP